MPTYIQFNLFDDTMTDEFGFPGGALLRQVASEIHPNINGDPNLYVDESRRVLRAVAAWLRSKSEWSDTAEGWARLLENEAEL